MPAPTNYIDIKSEEQYRQMITNGVYIVKISATWCGPCQAVQPAIYEMLHRFPAVKLLAIDTDELGDLSAELGSEAVPTLFLFKDGKQVSTVVGASMEKIGGLIELAASLISGNPN